MKTILTALTVAATAVTVALAPTANAGSIYGGGYQGDHDPYAIWSYGVGLGVPPSETIATVDNFAINVCSAMDRGISEGAMIHTAYIQYGVSPDVAQLVLHAVEYHYCPWNY